MAPNPQCAALNSAMAKSGISYGQLATKIGKSEEHVIDVCTGKVKPTTDEFNALATALGIKETPPSTGSHSTV